MSANKGNDMIVNLTELPEYQLEPSIRIKRAFITDKEEILSFIRDNFNEGWVHETECALLQSPPKCFIATEHGKLLGFACYDASAKGFFGPTGVNQAARGRGVGKALLLRTLEAMREYGYDYAVIGWVDDAEPFYRKTVGAEWIAGGTPDRSVYANRICVE